VRGILIAWVAIFGAAAGSFLNVVIYRLPRGFSVRRPSRSACPSCGRKLLWRENVPLLSYLFLRGRCGGCGTKISPRYPLVESMTAALFVAVFLHFELTFATLYYCAFIAALVAVTFIDLDFRLIPDAISFPGLAVGVFFSPFVPGLGILSSLEGVAVGGGFFFAMRFLYERFTNREGIGLGDVKLLAMIGAFLGVGGAIATVMISSIVGSIVGLTIAAIQKKNLKLALPYGPFLTVGALAWLFWGDVILARFYPTYT
jgi:leader peptidase (prepilin peptidase)/N-methyltransferase